MKKPKPVAVTTVCSMCGLGWELHGEDPTTEDCIHLLKAELARRPAVVNFPVYPRPYVQPIWPNVCNTSGSIQQQQSQIMALAHTPRTINVNCTPVTT